MVEPQKIKEYAEMSEYKLAQALFDHVLLGHYDDKDLEVILKAFSHGTGARPLEGTYHPADRIAVQVGQATTRQSYNRMPDFQKIAKHLYTRIRNSKSIELKQSMIDHVAGVLSGLHTTSYRLERRRNPVVNRTPMTDEKRPLAQRSIERGIMTEAGVGSFQLTKTSIEPAPGEFDDNAKRHIYDVHYNNKKVGQVKFWDYSGGMSGTLFGKKLPEFSDVKNPQLRLQQFLESEPGVEWADGLKDDAKELLTYAGVLPDADAEAEAPEAPEAPESTQGGMPDEDAPTAKDEKKKGDDDEEDLDEDMPGASASTRMMETDAMFESYVRTINKFVNTLKKTRR